MEVQKNSSLQRSKLSTASFIKWLRTRFNNQSRINFRYLYFPQQLFRQTSIQKIFVQFDADGSGGLSRDEVYDMFNGFGIQITMDHLNRLYDSVQVNLQELDCKMFKKCALSEKSNKAFRQIVRQLDGQYLPHNFTNMIVFLVYLSKRQELKRQVQKQKNSIKQKIGNIDKLLKLKDLSINNEKLQIHADAFKRNLKNKFKDIWQKCNQKNGQKFPHTLKLQEQFHLFYKIKVKKQNKSIQNL